MNPLATCCVVVVLASLASASPKYNVLMILIDDVSTERFPEYGNEALKGLLPGFEELKADGAVFHEHLYSPSSMCAPAQVALFSGMEPTQIGGQNQFAGDSIPGLQKYHTVPDPEVKFVPEALREMGYWATAAGKLDYQVGTVMPTFYDEITGGMLSDTLSAPVFDRFADPAIDSGRPFYSMINMMDTHQFLSSLQRPAPVFLTDPETGVPPADLPFKVFGYTTPAALLYKEGNVTAPGIASTKDFDKVDIVGYRGAFDETSISHANGGIPGYMPEDIGIASILSKEYDLIRNVDYRLQKYIAKLKAEGVYDDTLIMIFGDHGSGTFKAKILMQRQSLHTPMWIKYPKDVALSASVEQKTGVDGLLYNVDSRMTSLTDFYPTILSVLGRPKESYMTGRAVGGMYEDTSPERDMIFGSMSRLGGRVYKTFVGLTKTHMYQKNQLTLESIEEVADEEWGQEAYNTEADAIADALYENRFTFFSVAPIYRRMQRLMKQNAHDEVYLQEYMGITADGVMPPSEAMWDLTADPDTKVNLLRSLEFDVHRGAEIQPWGNNVTSVTLAYTDTSESLPASQQDILEEMRSRVGQWVDSQKWIDYEMDLTDRYAEENAMAEAFWPGGIQPQTGKVTIALESSSTAKVSTTTNGTVVRMAALTSSEREQCAQLPQEIRSGNSNLSFRNPGFEAEDYTLQTGYGTRTMRGFVYSTANVRKVVWSDAFGSTLCTMFVKEDGTFMELACPLASVSYAWDTRDSTWNGVEWVGVDDNGDWEGTPVTVWDDATDTINMDALATYVIGPDRDQMHGSTHGQLSHQVALNLGVAPPKYWALPGFDVSEDSIPTAYDLKGILDPVAWYWSAAEFSSEATRDLDNKGSFRMTLVTITDSPSRVDSIDVSFASFAYYCLPWIVVTEVPLSDSENTHVFAQGVRKGYMDTRFFERVFSPVTVPTEPRELPVDLKTAGNYAILAKSGISTVPQSQITGDIAISPIAGTAMTGFSVTLDESGSFFTSMQVTGVMYSADIAEMHPQWFGMPVADVLTIAVLDMETAYTNATGRTATGDRLNLGNGALGGAFGGAGNPLTPGVYTFGSGVAIGDDLYLQGSGTEPGFGDTDVFIIQMTGVLSIAANKRVILSGGVLPQNVFWQVAGSVLVAAGAHLEGIILCKTDVLFETGSSLNGRVLAQTACNLQMAIIAQPHALQD